MSLTIVCRELKNWFEQDKIFHEFVIRDGVLIIPENIKNKPQNNQYIRIVGSVFNDGVYKFPASGLVDETFYGAVWLMAVPKEVEELSDDIEAWNAKYMQIDSEAMSPFQSESFGGYSYNKASYSNVNGRRTTPTWQSTFASRLNQWRKI